MQEIPQLANYYQMSLSRLNQLASDESLLVILLLSSFAGRGDLAQDDSLWETLRFKLLVARGSNSSSEEELRRWAFDHLSVELVSLWEKTARTSQHESLRYSLEETIDVLRNLLIAKQYQIQIQDLLHKTPQGTCLVLPWETVPHDLSEAFQQGGHEECLILAPKKAWMFERMAEAGGRNPIEFLAPDGTIAWVVCK